MIQMPFQSCHGPTHVNCPQDAVTALNEARQLDANNNNAKLLNRWLLLWTLTGLAYEESDNAMSENALNYPVASTAAAS